MSLPTGNLVVTASQWRELREWYEDPSCFPDEGFFYVYDAELSIAANSQEEADARLSEVVQHLDKLDGVSLNILDNCEVLYAETGEPVQD